MRIRTLPVTHPTLRQAALVLLLLTPPIASVRDAQEPAIGEPAAEEPDQSQALRDEEASAEIGQMLDTLYEAFCFDANSDADWDVMASLFASGATFVSPIRDGAPAKGVDADQFIADFKDWCRNGSVRETGLHERITHTKVDHFNNVGHAYVVFEGFVPGEAERRTLGLDCLQLVRDAGAWKVISFTSQYTNDDLPMPERFTRPEHARR